MKRVALAGLVRGWLACVAACAAGLPVAHAAAREAGLVVELRSSVQLQHAEVRLGDVATVGGGPAATRAALRSATLGRMPVDGRPVIVSREALAQGLQRLAALGGASLAWQGAEAVQIQWAQKSISAAEVVAVAQAPLQAWLAAHGDRVQLQAAALPADVQAPLATIRLVARPLAETRPRARMTVWVDVLADERFVRAVPVVFNVQAWRRLPTAVRDLPAGDPLKPDAVAFKELDLASLPGPVDTVGATALPLEAGLRLRRAVRAGEVLSATLLEAAPPVERGGWATLRLSSGPVLVERRVQVPQDAALGQTLRLRLPEATTPVLARVTGARQLELVQ